MIVKLILRFMLACNSRLRLCRLKDIAVPSGKPYILSISGLSLNENLSMLDGLVKHPETLHYLQHGLTSSLFPLCRFISSSGTMCSCCGMLWPQTGRQERCGGERGVPERAWKASGGI